MTFLRLHLARSARSLLAHRDYVAATSETLVFIWPEQCFTNKLHFNMSKSLQKGLYLSFFVVCGVLTQVLRINGGKWGRFWPWENF